MRKSAPVVVGLDLGTSKTKALACTLDGRTLSQTSESYDLITPRPGYVEQDANGVYRAALSALQRVVSESLLHGHEIIGIGISSAMHGLTAVDGAGEPIGPFMTWMDRRSSAIADGWREDGTALELYQHTGAPMHPMLPICKVQWTKQHDPELFKRASRFVSLKELLVFRWCGEWAIDYGIASATGMLDLRTKKWNAHALAAAGVDAARLSTPVSPLHVCRPTRGGIASSLGLDPSVPLVLASSDGALANLGVGALLQGEVALTLGTSGACRAVVQAPLLDAQGRTFCYFLDESSYIVGGATSSAGATLNWILDLVLLDVPAADRFHVAMQLAEKAPPGADGVTCLPFLSGERAPYWDASLRGAFIGLDLSNDRGTLIRAAIEAIVYTLYAVERILDALAGASQSVILSGGLTHAALFRTMIADIFGKPVIVSDQDEASAFGAAMMAAVAVGAIPTLRDIKDRVRYPSIEKPDTARAGVYRRAFERYRRAVEAVQPLDHQA